MNINDLIKESERELRMRENVYPKWVESKKLNPETADRQIAAMKGILSLLKLQSEIFETTNQECKRTLYKQLVDDWKPAPPKVEQPRLFEYEETRTHYDEH